jgi:tRNA (guanine37-N1)-methyltransferase
MRYSYDIIGDIAVIEMPREGKPEGLARDIRKTHPRVKTVLARTGERKGEFRLWKMRKIFGKETETVHREHGFRFMVDPTKVYFSPREATERERIASMVRPKETVMVMFAGVGPYGIVIAGKQPDVRKVCQVEMNPAGFGYMKRNISMNKLSHKVVPVLGDVKKAVKDYEGLCDRVVMPLPRQAHEFLGSAMRCLKSKGVIHFYSVDRHAKGVKGKQVDEELFGEAVRVLEVAARRLGRSVRILARRKVLPFSPGAWKICIDARVTTPSGRGRHRRQAPQVTDPLKITRRGT